jgi:hypothetical protein
MIFRIISALAVAACLFDSCLAEPPIEAFAALPQISQPSLSPDGNRLAMIRQVNNRPAVAIYDLANPTNRPVGLPYSDGFVVGVQWKSNSRLLITVQLNQRPD